MQVLHIARSFLQTQKGSIIGTALAAIVIGIMRFGLVMSGLSTQYLDIPIGLLLIIAVTARTIRSNTKFINTIKKRFRLKSI